MAMTPWPDEHITILRRMLAEGKPSHVIAEKLGRKASSVRRYVSYNKDRMGFVMGNVQGRGERVDMMEFERDWKGPVPYLHWSITKPWRISK